MKPRTLWIAAAVLMPAPAAAQYIGGRPPEPPPAPVAGMVESPEAALARNVRLLAINPRDYNALLGAGRAALRLGDPQAAIGFFGRAEEVNSAHWAPKAGQGSALAQMGEGTAALGMFEQAQRLGATQNLVALDRGLAFDLLGRQTEAQSDYRAVLSGPEEAEARRRLALSLGISNRRADALAALDPLLARRDAGARRSRAFILALGGDVEGARQAIAGIMPNVGNGFDPFLRRLATLGPAQKAAAVHLGLMPAEGAALATAEELPRPALVQAPVRIVSAAPQVTRPRPSADRLAEIETSLTKLPSIVREVPPPAPRPIVERTPRRTAATTDQPVNTRLKAREDAASKPVRTAAATSATKRKVDDARTAKLDLRKAEDDKSKRKDEKAGKVGASRIYVQLAGGAKADRMAVEYNRIKGKKAALFRSRQPIVSEVRGWSRLLIGPFKDQDEAQDFVNSLHAAKLEGFVWTAPAGTKFEKLASR